MPVAAVVLILVDEDPLAIVVMRAVAARESRDVAGGVVTAIGPVAQIFLIVAALFWRGDDDVAIAAGAVEIALVVVEGAALDLLAAITAGEGADALAGLVARGDGSGHRIPIIGDGRGRRS